MLGRQKDVRGIVDADGVVGRRMEHQQRFAQAGDLFIQRPASNVVEELALDGERASGEFDLQLALFANVIDVIPKQTRDMRRIAGRGDRHHGACVRNAMRGGQHCGAAERVADQDRRWPLRLAQVIGSGDQILHVRREMRVGEFALAGAESGEIEAEHGDALLGQSFGDAFGGEVILPAGEAMREQRIGRRLAERLVQCRGEKLAFGIGKSKAAAAHGAPSFAVMPGTGRRRA